jgi:polar amino acid transport system substrate-binding protein
MNIYGSGLRSGAQVARLALVAAVVAAASLATTGAARADAMIGNCKVTGQRGQYPIKAAVPGQLTVEVGLPAPGWWNGDSPDSIKDGYEYCMAANIAYRGGLDRVEVVNVAWAQLLGGQTRGFDLALTEASITEERKKTVDFSIPYFASDIGILVRSGTHVDRASMKQMRIGVEQATTAVNFVTDKIAPVQPMRVYPNISTMYGALSSNQVDAVLYDTAEVLGKATQSGGSLVVAGQYSTGESYGAIYPKDSPNEASINQIIKSLQDDGTLQRLSTEYLAKAWGSDPARIPYLKP